jgi:iron complex transport system ATP-binding protein
MEPLLTAEGISFGYDDSRLIFSGLSFHVRAGEVLCILGANGCGKTTLMRCLSGALRVKQGRVLLGSSQLAKLAPTAIAREMGIVFQEHSAPFPFLVSDVVAMGRAPHLGFLGSPSAKDRHIALDALSQVGVEHLAAQPYTQISGGERQMVLIARCLAQQPKILLFDEPTSHLDYKNQARLLDLIRTLSRTGIAIVMTTHNPNHALMFPTSVAMMNGGRFIALGDADNVIDEPNLRSTYEIGIRVLTAHDGQRTHKFCSPYVGGHEDGDCPKSGVADLV